MNEREKANFDGRNTNPEPCDFAWWDKVMDGRPLTLWEAACLWEGIDPRRTKSDEKMTRCNARLRSLVRAIERGELKAENANPIRL